jgi:hypothetical protein
MSINQPRITFGTNNISGDIIDNLPTDQSAPSHNEIQLVDTLFQKQKTMLELIMTESKDVIVVGFLFLLFLLPQSDEIIKKFIHSANNSEYILMISKVLIFMLAYFILKNMYLVRRK